MAPEIRPAPFTRPEPAPAVRRPYLVFMRVGATDLLPDITTPTLVAAAGADVFTPARCSEAIHHAVVGSELITFADAGHTLPIEEPQALAAAIGDFVVRRIAVKPRPRTRTKRSS